MFKFQSTKIIYWYQSQFIISERHNNVLCNQSAGRIQQEKSVFLHTVDGSIHTISGHL